MHLLFLLPSLPPSILLTSTSFIPLFCLTVPQHCLLEKSLLRNLVFLSLTQDFRSAVTEAADEEGQPVLDEQRLGEILSVLPQVYNLHSSILAELEERISNW